MLVNLIASDNTLSFNIQVAQRTGLNTAVYLSEIVNIYNKACRKKKVDAEGHFMVDRKYVESRTTLDETTQYSLDAKLAELNIVEISKSNKDNIKVNLDSLASVITCEDTKALKQVKDILVSKDVPKKMSQRQIIINNLKSIASHPNEELNQAYKDWVDGVYSNPKGFLSKKSITIFMQSVDNYAKGDLDLALKIIDIATVNGYRECQWAINTFEKDFKRSFYQNRLAQTNKVSQENPSILIGDEKF